MPAPNRQRVLHWHNDESVNPYGLPESNLIIAKLNSDMDDIVRQAMAKWPNVPHCYGWLRLDARGNWRMCDEQAQALRLPGDKISNPVLLNFICRNYTHDKQGQWYFQNGPQRVYVDLEVAPFIARTDPAHGFVLHTGSALQKIHTAWMTENGQLVLQSAEAAAILDDRDLGPCIEHLRLNDQPVNDEQLLSWLDASSEDNAGMTWHSPNGALPVRRILENRLAEQFRFVRLPRLPQLPLA